MTRDANVCVLTGATGGIGRELARGLARSGARLLLPVRDPTSGQAQALVAKLREDGADDVELFATDLSRPTEVMALCASLRAREAHLDVLMNNAGVYLPTREATTDGLERVFATNILAYHLMIRELSPLLASSGAGRVVNTASSFAGDLDVTDLEWTRRRYNGTKSYRQSKAADRLLSWAWARRLRDENVTVNAFMPGLVMTPLYRHTGGSTRLFMRALGAFIGRSAELAASTGLWLALDPALAATTGALFEDKEERERDFADVDLEEAVFAYCERRAHEVTGGPTS